MSDRSHNGDNDVWMLVGVVILVLFVLIFTYAAEIISFLGAVFVGAISGVFVSFAIKHLGKKWGFVGFLELIVIMLSFRFLFGNPYDFDSWSGVFSTFGLVLRFSDGYINALWIVIGVALVISTIVFSRMWSDGGSKWDDHSEKVQNSVTQWWSEIVEFLFWVPSWFSRQFAGESRLVEYLTFGVIIAGFYWAAVYLKDYLVMAQVAMSASIFLLSSMIFRESLKKASILENQRIADVALLKEREHKAQWIEWQKQEERKRIEKEKFQKEQTIAAIEAAKERQMALEKQRLLKEAIDDARPGQGKRTDLRPINEKDFRDDDLF